MNDRGNIVLFHLSVFIYLCLLIPHFLKNMRGTLYLISCPTEIGEVFNKYAKSTISSYETFFTHTSFGINDIQST